MADAPSATDRPYTVSERQVIPVQGAIQRWKRNKKVAIKPLLQVLTVLHFDFCCPTHHSPSWLGFVRHDARLHGSIASFLWVCVAH